ncbi:MAG: ferritin-like domain-containing protein, partial [Candidatus Nitrosopolaris sp.]
PACYADRPSPQEVKAITEAVNPLIADAFALYVKTKNFHWHLYGSHFRDYHLLLDEHADAIFDSIDIMAGEIWNGNVLIFLDRTTGDRNITNATKSRNIVILFIRSHHRL